MSINDRVFKEGKFWLARYGSELTMYHTCPSGSTSHDILFDYEIAVSECYFCGKIKIPESIKTLWVLYNS